MADIEPLQVDLIAASLRSDSDDIEVMARVLTTKLASALPEDMVEYSYAKSLSDRVASRRGTLIKVVITFPSRALELQRVGHGAVAARVLTIVRGVTISRNEVPVSTWLETLAGELAQLAQSRTSTRNALLGMLNQ